MQLSEIDVWNVYKFDKNPSIVPKFISTIGFISKSTKIDSKNTFVFGNLKKCLQNLSNVLFYCFFSKQLNEWLNISEWHNNLYHVCTLYFFFKYANSDIHRWK